MSTSQAMIKRQIHIVLVILMMLISASVEAQYVNIRLELPAGIHFNSQLLDPMNGGTWENSKAKVWIGIESRENLSFLLDLDFPEEESEPPLEAYFLNDGTSNFESAKRLREGNQELQMINPPKLIRNAAPRPSHYQVWLGLPLVRGLTVKIEYP